MKTKIQKQLEALEPRILKLENAMAENFLYNFEWGYMNEILSGQFLANSSNRASNEAGLLRKEAKVEILKYLKQL